MKSSVKRDHIFESIELLVEPIEIPVVDGIVNFQKAVDGWRRRLLVGVLDVSKRYIISPFGAHSEKKMETW